MIDGLVLLLGLVVLIKGAGFLVEGASVVASRYGVSGLVIGLTVVSFGTSMPELLVSLTSGLKNNPEHQKHIGDVAADDVCNRELGIVLQAGCQTDQQLRH